MDTKYIIGGGVLLGVVLLAASKPAKGNNGAAVAISAIEANAARDINAPGIIAAYAQIEKTQNERRQIELAAKNASDSRVYDFMEKMDSQAGDKLKNVLGYSSSITNAFYGDESDRRRVKADLQIQMKRLANEEKAIEGQIQVAKKQAEGDFLGKIFGGVTGLVSSGAGIMSGGISLPSLPSLSGGARNTAQIGIGQNSDPLELLLSALRGQK